METSQMFEYLREDIKRIEGKLDTLVDSQSKATAALVAHTEEDHRNFEAIHLDIQAMQVKDAVLKDVKTVDWTKVTTYLNLVILLGTAVVMYFHK